MAQPLTATRPGMTTQARKGGWRPAWRDLGAGLVALVIAMLALELLFALAGIGEQEYLRIDRAIGFSPMERKHVTWRKEGFSRAYFNSAGMRDIERPIEKPSKTVRVAILGDSYTEALQVDRDKTFCRLLEDRLNGAHSGFRYEVLNFGVSSYNLGQIYLRLKQKAFDFKPDIVIFPVKVDASFQLAPKPDGGFLYARPSFFLGEGGRLVKDDTVFDLWMKSGEAKRLRATEWLRRYSHIWGVIATAVENMSKWWRDTTGQNPLAAPALAAQTPTALATPHSSAQASRLVERVRTPAENNCTRYFWPIAHALFAQAKIECEQHGAKLVVLRLPGVRGDDNKVESELLRQSCGALGLPLVDLTGVFKKAVIAEPEKLFYIFHFTPRGHEIVADEIYAFLEHSGMIANLSAAATAPPRSAAAPFLRRP